MKFKFDENIGSLGKSLLEAEGHDVMTVSEQSLNGASDEHLYQICCDEKRVLVTLDHDFGHVLRFPPERIAGIVILEIPGRLTPDLIRKRVAEFVSLLRIRPIARELWIIEPGRARIRERSS